MSIFHKIFIDLKVRTIETKGVREAERKREREREIFSFTGSLANSYNGQGWTRPKPGTRTFIWVIHIGERGPSIWAMFCAVPRPVTGSGIRSGTIGTWNSAPYGMPALQAIVNLLCYNDGPHKIQVLNLLHDLQKFSPILWVGDIYWIRNV